MPKLVQTMPKKSFITLSPANNDIKLYFSVIHTTIDATTVNILRKHAKNGVNYGEKVL
jgi:hypothetical protein